MEWNGKPGAAPAVAPLLPRNLHICFVYFMLLHRLLHKIARGGYIVGFRSRQVSGAEVCSNWTHEGEVGPHHTARLLGRVVCPLSFLMAFHVDFFSRSSISRKINGKKYWVHLTSERSLEVKNMQNKKICFTVFKLYERDCLENPSIQ
jgi:hypothetical protein